MINAKKLIKLARGWQKTAALNRKRISLPRSKAKEDVSSDASSSGHSKGHLVVYTNDQKRFVFPIAYLNKYLFRELLRMSEEEYGLPSEGPITLPFDSVTMEYVVSLIRRNLDGDMEKALITSVAISRCSSIAPIFQGHNNQQSLVCSF